jgi:hypothetical protein
MKESVCMCTELQLPPCECPEIYADEGTLYIHKQKERERERERERPAASPT